MHRRAQPTAAARKRRTGANLSFVAQPIPPGLDKTTQRAMALDRVDEPIDRLRMYVLLRIEALAPGVLRDLTTVDPHDQMALDNWIRRTGIDAPWLRTVASNTLVLWESWPGGRGRRFDLNIVNTARFVPERGRRPGRPAEILVRGQHVDWLIENRVLRVPLGADDETRRKAITRLARRLGISSPKK